jgi:hypothetical protein
MRRESHHDFEPRGFAVSTEDGDLRPRRHPFRFQRHSDELIQVADDLVGSKGEGLSIGPACPLSTDHAKGDERSSASRAAQETTSCLGHTGWAWHRCVGIPILLPHAYGGRAGSCSDGRRTWAVTLDDS